MFSWSRETFAIHQVKFQNDILGFFWVDKAVHTKNMFKFLSSSCLLEKLHLKEMVFCYQNCSHLLWEKIVPVIEEKLKFEAEGQEFAKFLRSLEEFIQTMKGQNNFCKQNTFLTCSWRFLISSKLEQLEFKLEKIIGI